MTREHELKTWPQYFAAILDGSKTFEARFDDREFEVGDVLHLREWNPETEAYTGRETRRTVSYKLSGGEFVRESYCILALAPDASPSETTGGGAVAWRKRVDVQDALNAITESVGHPQFEYALPEALHNLCDLVAAPPAGDGVPRVRLVDAPQSEGAVTGLYAQTCLCGSSVLANPACPLHGKPAPATLTVYTPPCPECARRAAPAAPPSGRVPEVRGEDVEAAGFMRDMAEADKEADEAARWVRIAAAVSYCATRQGER